MPHLASHVLGLALGRVRADWQMRYGQAPVLAETFVDPARFRGTACRAANWVLGGHPVVLAAQDTSDLDYTDHPATRELGPLQSIDDLTVGLKLHSTMAFSPQGAPRWGFWTSSAGRETAPR